MRWRPVVIAAAAALCVAALGGSLTDLGSWYHHLREPSWKPPDWAFGPIWTAIFALAAAAGVTAWNRAQTYAGKQWIIGLFAANGFLNVLWSLIFFKLQRPDHALVEVLFLWASILALIVTFWRRAPLASLLLAPYAIWVTLAALLNYQVVLLNGPFA